MKARLSLTTTRIIKRSIRSKFINTNQKSITLLGIRCSLGKGVRLNLYYHGNSRWRYCEILSIYV